MLSVPPHKATFPGEKYQPKDEALRDFRSLQLLCESDLDAVAGRAYEHPVTLRRPNHGGHRYMRPTHTRREFLADVGRGMLVATVGYGVASELGFGPAFAAEADDTLNFGALEPL